MASEPQVSFSLKTETTPKQSPRLYQPDLFPQWYEFYIVNETEDPIPMPPKRVPFDIKAWWQNQ